MNSRLLAASILAAGFALDPLAQAEEMNQIFFVLYDDTPSASLEAAAPVVEQPGPTDSDRQLAELRQSIARDMEHE